MAFTCNWLQFHYRLDLELIGYHPAFCPNCSSIKKMALLQPLNSNVLMSRYADVLIEERISTSANRHIS
jgi:hypothetical protein